MYRTSAKGRRELAEQLLRSSDEFEISDSYTSRVAEIFAVILKSLGLKLEFIDEDNVIQEFNDDQIKMHVLDGQEYFCTDYQFMLVERKKSIEKELLSKYGVIDKDELDKQVMVELVSRNFIIGPVKEDIPKMPAFLPDTVTM